MQQAANCLVCSMEPSFTSFPEGEGPTNPDIPSEPMLNKLYNKVLSLTTSAKPPNPISTSQQQPAPPLPPPPVIIPTESPPAAPPPQETTTGLGISLGGTHQSRNPSVTSIGASDANVSNPTIPPPQLEKIDVKTNRQSMIKSAEKSPDVLEPILSPVNAIGGLTRSEDGTSVVGSDKPSDSAKQTSTKAHLREINLPGLAGFRLTREPSSDSESIASSFGVHPSRTVDRIIGRLKTGDLGREFWMKDESSHECFLCGEKFTSK